MVSEEFTLGFDTGYTVASKVTVTIDAMLNIDEHADGWLYVQKVTVANKLNCYFIIFARVLYFLPGEDLFGNS